MDYPHGMQPITSTAEIGATLAARRKHLELTQQIVASHVGLSQNRLSVLESRPETLTVEQLIALLNVLGLEMRIGERIATKPSTTRSST
jgi:HTH-type transcriptional regulator/antitoxin HipB